MLFQNPFVTARSVSTQLSVSTQGALNLIRAVERKGWLTEIGTVGRGGRVYWYAPRVFRILEQPRGTGADDEPTQMTLSVS